MKKYYGQKPNGEPWTALSGGDVKYVCVVDTEKNTGMYLYSDGKTASLSGWQVSTAASYWKEIPQSVAFALLGLKQEPKFYIRVDGSLFDDKNDYFVVFFKGADAYAYHASGAVQFLPWIGERHRAAWKEVSYEKARSMLGRKPNFNADALAEVMGLKVKPWTGAVAKIATEAKVADDKSTLIYRHFRYSDDWGDVYGGGGVTVGVIINHTKKVLEVYPVVCHKEDTFQKARGRDYALQRYNHKFGVQIPYDESESIGYNIFIACDKHVDGMQKLVNVSGCKGGRDWELLVDTFARTMCDGDLIV